MKKAIPTHKLKDLMPHRGKMLWVDEVIHTDGDKGEVKLTLQKDFPYFQNGKLISSFFIEFMAQGYGFMKAAFVYDEGIKGLDEAMIPMISDYEFYDLDLMENNQVIAKIKTKRQLDNLFFVEGSVVDENEKLLAKANFKVYAQVV